MLTYNDLRKVLPDVLVIYIGEYNPEHRKQMKLVFDELDDYHKTVCCDNDMCERPFHIDNAWIGHMWFSSNHDYYFCCEDCKSYGEWSLTYDYRKSMRRR